MIPRYPMYVISKGRWDTQLTARALMRMGAPFEVVIEPQEEDLYRRAAPEYSYRILPFSNLGQGSIPARNWVWEDSIRKGARRHWILDDNIRGFYRLHKNRKYLMSTPTCFCVIEDLADRYKNVALAGMQYEFFAPRKYKRPPLILNTRIYSNILIKNDLPYRWRGRYNEDTDLSLRALKDGWCTILTNAFLANKVATMTMKGGNTDSLYAGDGRLKMAQSLVKQHPDCVSLKWKWGRWQHEVDYRPFKKNVFVRREDVTIPDEPNEYGLRLIPTAEPRTEGEVPPPEPEPRTGKA